MEWWQILLIVLAVLVAIGAVLYFYGKKLQTQAEGQQSIIDQSKIVTKILIIDKKKMKITDSALPQIVQDQVPWYVKWRKMPMVKAKIGPKIQTLICDEKIFKELPVKKTVKAELAGLYIVGIKGGQKENPKDKKKDKKKAKDKKKK